MGRGFALMGNYSEAWSQERGGRQTHCAYYMYALSKYFFLKPRLGLSTFKTENLEFPLWLSRLRTWLVSVRMWIFHPWPCSVGYGASNAMSCGAGRSRSSDLALPWAVVQASSCHSDLTPGPGTSTCHRCIPKKKHKTATTTKNKTKNLMLLIFCFHCDRKLRREGVCLTWRLITTISTISTFLENKNKKLESSIFTSLSLSWI